MGARKLTLKEILRRFVDKHGNRYDYSKVKYAGAGKKICVTCRLHGDFWTLPGNHLAGRGCSNCGKKKSTFESNKAFRTFIREKFEGKILVDSNTKYDGLLSKTEVSCLRHGKYIISCRTLASGKSGCPGCFKDYLLTQRLEKAKASNLIFSKTEFVHRRDYVTVECKKHGELKLRAHRVPKGCPVCNRKRRFKRKLKELSVRRDYDYSGCSFNYYLRTKKITPICKKHGKFAQQFRAHKGGQGCPTCNSLKNPAVFHKWKSSMYRFKEYTLKSGKTVSIQGYEGLAIDIISKEVDQKRLKFGKDVPSIPYIFEDKSRMYYPDLAYGNTLVEVKSTWTWKKGNACTRAKLEAALDLGYRVRLMIFDGKHTCVKDKTRYKGNGH